MKVKCIKIINEHTNEHQKKSSWISIGKDYVVLAIEVRVNSVNFLIMSDANNQPILQNAIQFEVISKKIPTTWTISAGAFELLSIGPQSWQEPGFWNECYDHNPRVLEIYKREAKVIIEQEKN